NVMPYGQSLRKLLFFHPLTFHSRICGGSHWHGHASASCEMKRGIISRYESGIFISPPTAHERPQLPWSFRNPPFVRRAETAATLGESRAKAGIRRSDWESTCQVG